MGSLFALTAVLIYRCTVGGVTTFSDRPCAPDAAVYQPDTSRISAYDPPPASKTATSALPVRTERKRGRATANADPAKHAATCERLRISLKEIAARMRAGYNVKQGEQLRERKAKMEQQRRAEKCR